MKDLYLGVTTSVPLKADTSKGKEKLENSRCSVQPVSSVKQERLPMECSLMHLVIASYMSGTMPSAGDTVLGMRQFQ